MNSCFRRQYLIHQLEKDIKKKTLEIVQRNCIKSWRFVISQKHKARDLYQSALSKKMFSYWKGKAFTQIKNKKEDQERMVSETFLYMYLSRQLVLYFRSKVSYFDDGK